MSASYKLLSNDSLTVGIDPSRGAGICWLSRPNSTNLLNDYDCGRYIQQSYYGKEDGSDWNGTPWRWNPVQVGSWQNKPSKVVCCSTEGSDRLKAEVIPRNWAGQQLCEDVVMRSDIRLQRANKHAHVTFTMHYTGTDRHPPRIQELPAVFVKRNLGQLVFYDGPEPWKGKGLTTKWPGFPNENYRITESWAAWIDPSTGEGVGVYTPVAQSMTCYRVGPDGSTACSDCCYCAPTMRFSITLDTKLAYSCFVMVGTVEQIRKEFSGIRSWAKVNNPQLLQCQGMADAVAAI